MNIPQPMQQPLTQSLVPVLTPNMQHPVQFFSLDGSRCSTPTPSLSLQQTFYPLPTPPPAIQTTPMPRLSPAPTPPVCVTQSMSAFTEATPEIFDTRSAEYFPYCPTTKPVGTLDKL